MFEVCFVCLGNICRSPMAEGVFRKLVAEEGLEEKIRISSAGTGGWHVGSPPDARAQSKARRHGIVLDSVAEQFTSGHLPEKDLILAMDRSNLDALVRLSGGELPGKLMLFRDFDPQNHGDLDVPDPYYGGPDGFDTVFQIIERTCPKILAHVRERAGW